MTSGTHQPHYHTFLSHSAADKPIVERLARKLKEAGIEPWLDKWTLIPGTLWQEQIERALADCETFCVCIGPREMGPWQNAEMRAAIDRRISAESSFRVIPVLLPGSQRPERSKLPTFLTQTTWVEFRQDLDDAESFHRLTCAIHGIAPGTEPGQKILAGVCPYRGLEVFDVQHAAFFFGREALTEWSLDQLRPKPDGFDNRFLAIIGPSGSGKSSLARAGLVAALNNGALETSADWPFLIVKPGADPFESLAVQFAADPGSVRTICDQFRSDARRLHIETRCQLRSAPQSFRLVILIDQFEQIFTLCQDPVARNMFIDNLLIAANEPLGQTLVLLTMRADFYGKCAEYPALAAALTDHQVLVGPMGDSELRAAIARPAMLAGCVFEPGLVDVLLDEVKDQAGGLPLLQFTLTELWNRRIADCLTFAAYSQLGGVRGTLRRRAEEVFHTLSPLERDIAKQVFLELTQLGEGVADTRRQVPMRTLRPFQTSRNEVERVIAKLSEARLIVMTDPIAKNREGAENQVIDVAHESLIRHWPRLRDWIDGNRFALRQKREIETWASVWLDKGKPSKLAYLLQGEKLHEASNFIRDHSNYIPLSAVAMEFVIKSMMRRRTNRIAILSLATSVFLIIAGTAVYAFLQSLEAQRYSVLALVSSAQNLYASNNQLEGLIEGIRAASVLQNPFVDQSDLRIQVAAGLNQMVYGIREKNRLEGHTAGVSSLAFSPDGRMLASASQDHTVKLWNKQGREMATLRGHHGDVSFVNFSPDGSILASAGYDGTIRLWKSTGEAIDVLRSRNFLVHSVSFSNKNNRMISSDNGGITFWDPDYQSHYHLGQYFEVKSTVLEAAFSTSGEMIATANIDGSVRLWDLDGHEIRALSGHDGGVTGISFSPDNELIASAGRDKTVKIWALNGGAPPKTLVGHSGAVMDISFSPDGRTLASASGDKTIRIWRREGDILQTLEGHSDAVPAVRFAPDGASVASASWDKTIRLWRLESIPKPVLRHEAPIYAISFGLDDHVLATASLDGTVILWSRDGLPVRSLPHDSEVLDVAFSPDGETIGSASADGTIRLWTHEGGLLSRFKGHDGEVLSLSFSPDGVIASAGADGDVRLWNQSGTRIGTLVHEIGISRVAFANSGDVLAATSAHNTTTLWDREGRWLQTIVSGGGSGLAFSPDDELIATSLEDGRVQICRRKGRTYGKCIATSEGHREGIFSLDFSPDGQIIVSAGADNVIRLWNLKGELLANLSGHADWVRAVKFSKDGGSIASASLDRTAIVWTLDLENLVTEGCAWLEDYLLNNNRAHQKSGIACPWLWK